MIKLPQIESITTLKNNYKTILSKLSVGPVVLTQNAKTVAVLVDPEEWQRSAERLERLERAELLRRRIAEAHEDLAACPTLDEFVVGLG
jgi:prevent-host-death family protein